MYFKRIVSEKCIHRMCKCFRLLLRTKNFVLFDFLFFHPVGAMEKVLENLWISSVIYCHVRNWIRSKYISNDFSSLLSVFGISGFWYLYQKKHPNFVVHQICEWHLEFWWPVSRLFCESWISLFLIPIGLVMDLLRLLDMNMAGCCLLGIIYSISYIIYHIYHIRDTRDSQDFRERQEKLGIIPKFSNTIPLQIA